MDFIPIMHYGEVPEQQMGLAGYSLQPVDFASLSMVKLFPHLLLLYHLQLLVNLHRQKGQRCNL